MATVTRLRTRARAVCGLLIVAAFAPGSVAAAADIIEPWAPGFSDLEVAVTAGDQTGDGGVAAVAGFGLGGGVSLGVTMATSNGGSSRGGLVAILTGRLGGRSDLDVWAETGIRSAVREAEVGRVDWALGAAWSLRAGGGVQPYARISRADGGTVAWHPLAGVMVPLGRVELHLELSSESPETGPWPVHVAVGPNLKLAPAVELQTELSLIDGRAGAGTHWAVAVAIVIDPSRVALSRR